MTQQDENFIARLKDLDNGLHSLRVLVINGQLVFWTEPQKERVEGFGKSEKVETQVLTSVV